MVDEPALICAFKLNGQGGGESLDWGTLDTDSGEGEFVWLHLRRTAPEAQEWLRSKSGLDPIIVDALLAEETRPRCTDYEDGILLNLRGVNLNPGAEPEDMLSIRMWITRSRIISARNLRLAAVDDIRKAIDRGNGPRAPGMLIAVLADRLVARMWPVISELDEGVDSLEDSVISGESIQLRKELADARRQAITMRRYLVPQRDAMARLISLEVPFIGGRERNRIREVYDSILRHVETLDEIRERAAVIQDELSARIGDMMNRKLYILSVAAAIFLPLNLLAGMMGMNVAGIPGTDFPMAFLVMTITLIVLGLAEYWFMKRLKWI